MPDERYQRHQLIDWFDQDVVAESSVIVVGAGAIGNELLKDLCLLGVGKIHIIDFDLIEIHNLTRSILFTEKSIGSSKAETAAQACGQIDPNIEVTYETGDFWQLLSIEQVCAVDAVFCCVDNYEARIKLNKLCLLSNTDYYNAAIDSRYVIAERYPYSDKEPCACYECNLPLSSYERIRERYSCGWLKKTAFVEKKIPTTIITTSIAGAQLSSLFLQRKHELSRKGSVRCYTDTITLSSSVESRESYNECITCSTLLSKKKYVKSTSIDLVSALSLEGVPENTTLHLSDNILIRLTCKVCKGEEMILAVAGNYSDNVLFCFKSGCQSYSKQADIRDTMTFGEMKEIFDEHAVPVKYINFERGGVLHIYELEDKA